MNVYVFVCLALIAPFCAGFLDTSDHEIANVNDLVVLTSAPTSVVPGWTNHVTTSCRMESRTDLYDMIISIVVSKWDSSIVDYVEHATIKTHSPDLAERLAEVTATINGKILKEGESFLQLEWEHPTEEVTGTYHCEVNVLGVDGHPINLTTTFDLTLGELDPSALVEEIVALKTAQKDLTLEVSELVSSLDAMEALVGSLNSTCSCSGVSDRTTILELCNRNEQCITTEVKSSDEDAPAYICYKESLEDKTYKYAKEQCMTKGARLAEIHTNETLLFLEMGVVQLNISSWLGATDYESFDMVYKWESGDLVGSEVVNWIDGEPDGAYSGHCMYINERDGKWSDENCARDRSPYLCETSSEVDCKHW